MKWLLLALLLTGCSLVPARVPPQLAHTPGPTIAFREGYVLLGAFAVPVPPQWRVIKTSTAKEPLRVVLAAPDDTILITAALGARTIDSPSLPLRHEHTLTYADQTLQLVAQAADESAPALAALWPQILAEVHTP